MGKVLITKMVITRKFLPWNADLKTATNQISFQLFIHKKAVYMHSTLFKMKKPTQPYSLL